MAETKKATKKSTNKKNKGGNFKFYGLFKKYETVKEVQDIIEQYFNDCEVNHSRSDEGHKCLIGS